MGQNDITVLYNTLADIAKNETKTIGSSLSYGTVQTVDPLVIVREGEDESSRIPISSKFLVLSPHCRTVTIKAGHTHTVPGTTTDTALGGEYLHSHGVPQVTAQESLVQLTLWEGLKLGERVIMLSFNQGQKYYIEKLERWGNEV